MNDNDSALNMKDVYAELWRGRDFELKYFWQRAVFLSAFLFGCYIAYWELLLKLFEPKNCDFALHNTLAILVTMIGMVVSILWVLMAKGSKAWYEDWENGIYQFIETFEENGSLKGEHLKWAGFHFRDQITIPGRKQPDHNLLTTRGGRFSPSRINIAIGQLSALLFGAAFIFHLGVRRYELKCARELAQVVCRIPNAVILLVALLVAVLFFLFVKKQLVSNDL